MFFKILYFEFSFRKFLLLSTFSFFLRVWTIFSKKGRVQETIVLLIETRSFDKYIDIYIFQSSRPYRATNSNRSNAENIHDNYCQ